MTTGGRILNGTISALLREVKAGLETIYAERLKGVYLFGSYARGDYHDESDVDVLVVLDQVENYFDEIKRTSHLVADLSLQYEASISRVFVSEADWKGRDSMFLLNVRDDAVPL